MVELHGGHITAANRPPGPGAQESGGAVFTVRLPVAAERPVADEVI